MKNKLTKKQLKLQATLLETTIHNYTGMKINADLNIVRDGDCLTLNFTYHDDSARDDIYSLKWFLLEHYNVWFDSGFMCGEPVLEWSFDWSISSEQNETKTT